MDIKIHSQVSVFEFQFLYYIIGFALLFRCIKKDLTGQNFLLIENIMAPSGTII